MNCLYYHELNLIWDLTRDNMTALMISHEIWYAHIFTRENIRICKNKAVLLTWLKICPVPIIVRSNFGKNKAVLLKWFEKLNCPYYDELKFLQKQGNFAEPIRKFELHLLWQASIFSKIRVCLWYHLKIWTAPIITSWIFCKNIAYLMKPFEHLNCPHYHEV